tara:strand:+ start:217 stop:1077 length:861 start_codon:yes stop_codon:yes gene_type:complete
MTTKILYYFLLLPISLLPYSILILISEFLYLIIYKIGKYREKVVLSNLKNSFPEKSHQELEKIMINFYRHLCDIIIEIIKMLNTSKSFIDNRVTISNIELLDKYINRNKTVILVAGHFNNWEWVGQKISILKHKNWVAVYKPLNNKVFDKILKKARIQFGGIALNMDDSIRYIIQTKRKTQIIGIIADQNPVVNSSTKWHNFFGRQVPVFMGTERIARKMDYPVIFCNMKKTKRGIYKIFFEELEKNPKNTNEGDITRKYFNRLEKQIKTEPSQWLWSHRRWKHKN